MIDTLSIIACHLLLIFTVVRFVFLENSKRNPRARRSLQLADKANSLVEGGD